MGKKLLMMIAGDCITVILVAGGLLDPKGIVTGVLIVGFTFGAMFFGAFWFAQIITAMTQPKSIPVNIDFLREQNAEKIVDYIDKRANESVISNNNEWLKRTWHSMNDAEKIDWANSRMEVLKVHLLASCNANSVAFINALQGADKEYQRSKKIIA